MRQLKFLVYAVAAVPDMIIKVKEAFNVAHVYRRDPLGFVKTEACDAVFIAEVPKPSRSATAEEKKALIKAAAKVKELTAAYKARGVSINPKPEEPKKADEPAGDAEPEATAVDR